MNWRIHTGPFPFMVHDLDAELWLWRITDGRHYTAVVVRLASGNQSGHDRDASERASAVATRGRSAVMRCLSWHEPPREILFLDGAEAPSYWGGTR